MPTTRSLCEGSIDVNCSSVSTGRPSIHSGIELAEAPSHAGRALAASPGGFRLSKNRPAARCESLWSAPRRAGRLAEREQPCVGLGAAVSSGFISNFSGETCSAKLALQERIVRRVFQQPAHEVGHAGDQLAVGHVDPQAIAQVDQHLFLGVAHAVEHLQFEAGFGQAQMPRHGHAMRQRADVVAGQRRSQVACDAPAESA